MKRFIYSLFVFVVIGCSIDDDIYTPDNASGIRISFKPSDNYIISKAVSEANQENLITNAYLFIFNKNGTLSYSGFFDNLVANAVVNIPVENVPAGDSKTVVAIANIGASNTIMSIPTNLLNNVNNINQLELAVAVMNDGYLERGTSFLMSGRVDNVNISLEGVNNISVPLYRVDSKIRFVISQGEGVKFTPLDWRLVSAPKKVHLFSALSDDFSDKDYFTSDYNAYESSNTSDSASFSFYMLESILNPKTYIPNNNDYSNLYALREKQEKIPQTGSSVENGDFVYAPKNSPYVEIRGNLLYQNESGMEVSADVVFTVHLGGAGNNVNDYSSLRNTFYTYHIKVLSVNDIIVEVDSLSGEEPRPGSEGDVVIAKVIKNVDAYNEVFTMTFSGDAIDSSITWNVVTVFSKGSASENPIDYNWVHFKINKKSGGIYSTNFVSYLGDSNVYSYEELFLNDDGTINETILSGTSYLHPLDKYMEDISNGTDKMLDVKELVVMLRESKNRMNGGNANNLFDSKKNISFTTFVNDYYYYYAPGGTSTVNDISLWKRFVNEKQRVLNILSNIRYSADGRSSKANALYSIRQASIQTMYNKFSDEDFTAWGSQMMQDRDLVIFSNEKFSLFDTWYLYEDMNNGRKNFANMIKNSGKNLWNSFIDYSTMKMKQDYDVAKYRCLRLNRDMNGNGRIDDNEIQWYLASIDQLTDIWIGEDSYNKQAKLYYYDTWEQQLQWYASSTVLSYHRVRNYKENPQILWAAEGSSIGEYYSSSTSTSRDIAVHYRCVRNLGIANEAGLDVFPDRFVTLNNNTVELSRLDSKSIRGFSTVNELPDHNERDVNGNNKPWRKFEFSSEIYGKNLTWEDVRKRSQPGGTNRVCPKGWRVPNQRELALIYSLLDRTVENWPAKNHLCRTAFSFGGTARPGFSVEYSADTFYLINNPNNEVGGVRCVRDVVD